ncbi:MAG TPA: TIM-barrel domain-containing protein [Chitinophagales bacterium]|nr:TIM-barrel domain-containing protein [Chitinophagales bacterium]
MFRTKFFLAALFALTVIFSQGCKKEDAAADNSNNNNTNTNNNNNSNNNNNTNNNNNNTQWNLPWPEWIFYHWVWEDESTQQSAQQLVDDYLSHDIPVGAIIIDSPWETGYNTFDWDNTLYPDPQGMIDYFHSKNVRVFIWITGVVNTDVHPLYDDAKAQGYFMKTSPASNNPGVVSWWKGDGSLIDWFNPAAVAWWKTLMDKTLNMGIDGWKCDGTDYYEILSGYSPGQGAFVNRLDYSHAYYRLFFDYTRQRLGNDRVITARPIDNYHLVDQGGDNFAFAPKDINFCGWVGDQDATFDGLRAALNNMYHSSQYGYLSFGSDIGGYREDSNNPPNMRSKEVFIRWAQLGAFSPVMENGGGGEHRPWMFDQQTEDIYRKLVKLRHGCLIPYLMTQAEIAYNENRSMMTFIDKTTYSYTLGSDIFVSPFLEEGTGIAVTFPAGSKWFYMYDETKIYEGGTMANLSVPYDEFPVFLKEGSPLIDAIDFSSIQ